MNIDIDIDIDDIVHSMGSYDRKELFRALQQDGYIPENITITNDGSIELSKLYKSDDDFNVALKKLYNNGWKLTLEEENYIINLSKRFL